MFGSTNSSRGDGGVHFDLDDEDLNFSTSAPAASTNDIADTLSNLHLLNSEVLDVDDEFKASLVGDRTESTHAVSKTSDYTDITTDLFNAVQEGLGNCKVVNESLLSLAKCTVCSRGVTWEDGIVCQNFSKKLDRFVPCQKAWCGACYVSKESIDFPVKKTLYDDANLKEEDQMRLREVWKTKHKDPTDYHVGRPGEHLMVPFECDLCVFRKLKGMSPSPVSHQDQYLMVAIRRVLLDAMWSRSRKTVTENSRRVKRIVTTSKELGLPTIFRDFNQPVPYDQNGYGIAVVMVIYSLRKGKNDEFLQFDTVRQLRAAFSNHSRVQWASANFNLSMSTLDGQYSRFVSDPCGSMWFSRFMEGMKARMGQITLSNKAFSDLLLKRLFIEVERFIESKTSVEEKAQWIVFLAYITISYVISLRGVEGLLLDLHGLHKHWKEGKGKYVIIPLLGQIKGEKDDIAHLIPCVETTGSGLNVRSILGRLMLTRLNQNWKFGPAIADRYGKVFTTQVLDDMLHEILLNIFQDEPTMFPSTVKGEEDIRKFYQCYRSFRRTSNTRAISQKVNPDSIDIVNRWRKVERSKGSRPSGSMKQHYAELEVLLDPFLHYTSKM